MPRSLFWKASRYESPLPIVNERTVRQPSMWRWIMPEHASFDWGERVARAERDEPKDCDKAGDNNIGREVPRPAVAGEKEEDIHLVSFWDAFVRPLRRKILWYVALASSTT